LLHSTPRLSEDLFWQVPHQAHIKLTSTTKTATATVSEISRPEQPAPPRSVFPVVIIFSAIVVLKEGQGISLGDTCPTQHKASICAELWLALMHAIDLPEVTRGVKDQPCHPTSPNVIATSALLRPRWHCEALSFFHMLHICALSTSCHARENCWDPSLFPNHPHLRPLRVQI
jgi:hypothetical protein